MRLNTRTWVVISLLCFIGAWYFWRLGEEKADRKLRNRPENSGSVRTNVTNPGAQGTARPTAPLLIEQAKLAGVSPATNVTAEGAVVNTNFPYRLSNTSKGINELSRSDGAILLRNALIDTASPTPLPIPAHLRAQGDPGTYIVQASGKLTDAFRERLRQAGATIVSYVPNNAYLVRVPEGGALQMAASPETQTVLKWEPYYKPSAKLLPLLMAQQNPEMELNVAAFSGEQQNARDAFEKLKVQILAEDRSPFGPQFHVRIPENTLVTLAQLPLVALIEPFSPRMPANDLARARVRVTTNTLSSTLNFRGLTGSNILVNVNDSGVYAQHPDLMSQSGATRVFGDRPRSLTDSEAHGTHVAGIIASTGLNGPPGNHASGSTNGASFRGMAPEANIFSIATESLVPAYCFSFATISVSDSYLQETAAATNAFVSNNSWGYGDTDYNLASASWDGAVRDALPGVTGPQPLFVVFAAGNSGGGNDQGTGGFADSVSSPGNSKNVMTVGAIENFRHLTNTFGGTPLTNQYFFNQTDTSNQVTTFSSRGNVGVGLEGLNGRFKPDVVAPGTFVVSTKPTNWVRPAIVTNHTTKFTGNIKLDPGKSTLDSIFAPPNAIGLCINVETNGASPFPFPPMLVHLNFGAPPSPGNGITALWNIVTNITTSGDWFYSVENTNKFPVIFDLRVILVTTNSTGPLQLEWRNLDTDLDPLYRYESGTSMSAPVVSGIAALMQEGFARDISPMITNAPSPALFKALLINGARSVNSIYNYRVNSAVNYQGWGLVNITNSFPFQSGVNPTNSGPTIYFDQSFIQPLATDQSYTRKITVSSNAFRFPLRVTLAWTDPPGNPAVATKLVNNLDLIVTNLDTGDIYLGNFFDGGTLSSEISSNTAASTNLLLLADNVNNVENIVVPSTRNKPLGTNYTVTVVARRVDVNSVDTVTNMILQDYALVIASDNPGSTSLLTLAGPDSFVDTNYAKVQFVTNGVPLFHQRVGANDPYLVSTNGNTNQWSFYIFTNAPNLLNTNIHVGPYIAFVTFFTPNLSRPRTNDADIDMYVSRDPAITNLDTTVVQAALRGVKRTGNETVFIDNAIADEVFYVGIKSEDQQAGEFAFFAVSSDKPFASTDSDGNIITTGFNPNTPIPDGNPEQPQGSEVFLFVPPGTSTQPVTIDNVVITNDIFHELGGDLLGNLSHDDQFVVLNNHRIFQGPQEYVYDDSDSGDILVSQTTDGPGSLRNFTGKDPYGSWILTMVDNAQYHTGIVNFVSMKIQPVPPDLAKGITVTILPNRWKFYPVKVPADATRLEVCAAPDIGPVEVYIRREAFPDRQTYDTFATISPPGDCISLTRYDSPPLSKGTYIVGIYNPNFTSVKVHVRVNIERDFGPGLRFAYVTNAMDSILDDATTNSTIFVNRKQLVADVSVGVRIDHPRVAELALHLVSPQGTRILLYEDRGWAYATNLGLTTAIITNYPTTTNGGTTASATNIISLPDSSGGTLIVDYNFYFEPDFMHVYYDDALIFDTDLISGSGTFNVDFGPGFSTNLIIVMNEGDNPSSTTLWTNAYTVISGGHSYVTFTEDTNKASIPIKFAMPPYGTNASATNSLVITNVTDFEAPTAQDYVASASFDQWTVLTNGVTVFNDPARAAAGNQFLSLADGEITRPLTTIAGADYRIRAAYQRECLAALYQAEGTSDSVSTNDLTSLTRSLQFTQGIAGLAFNLDGVSDTAFAPPSPALDIGASSNLTIECWIWPTDISRSQTIMEWSRSGYRPVSLSITGGGLQANLGDTAGINHPIGPQGGLDTTRFHHVAVTYSSLRNGGEAQLYIDGVSVKTQGTLGVFRPNTTNDLWVGSSPGAPTTFYAGRIDDIGLYNCALSAPEILAIYRAGTNGVGKCDAFGCNSSAQIVAGTSTRIVRGGAGWQSVIMDFSASSNVTALNLKGGLSSSLSSLFDSIDLLQKPSDPTLYYLPEESLSAFVGENAYGNWTLEVTDTRTGNAFTNGTVLQSWKLNINFVATNLPATILTNGQCISGTLPAGESAYYIVNVPILAAHATNHLYGSNGPLNLLYSTNGLPAGQFYARSLPPILTNSMDDIAVVGIRGTDHRSGAGALIGSTARPQLQPGGRYYLAVENRDTNGLSVDFMFCVNFDQADSIQICGVNLTNGVCYSDTLQATNRPNYYCFLAHTNVQLTFEVLGPNCAQGPTDWIRCAVQHDFCNGELPKLPPPGNACPLDIGDSFRIANNLYNNPIVITNIDVTSTNNIGLWFIAVYNWTTTRGAGSAVQYAVRVTERAPLNPISLTNIITITNNTPGTNVDYYVYTVSSNACRADFEILNPSGNVDLYLVPSNAPVLVPPLPVYPATYPSSSDYVYFSANAGTANELVTISDISSPAPITYPPNTPNSWYFAVTNTEMTPVMYTVRVTEYDANPIPLPNATPYTNTIGTAITNNVDYYSFDVSPNAVEVMFEILSPTNTTVKLFGARTQNLCQVANVRNVINAANDVITATTNGGNVISGNWYLAVTNIQATNVTYVIRATEILGSQVARLVNCQSTNVTIQPNGTDYYLFTVSANAVQANFETLNASGNVDLYIRPGLPLPSPTLFAYSGVNPGTSDELIIVTNGAPVNPLAPGEWYLAVVNKDAVPVTYDVRVSQFADGDNLITLQNTIPYTRTNSACPPGGIDYYRFTVSAGSQRAQFEVLSPSEDVDLIVAPGLPLPTFTPAPYKSTNSGTSDELIAVLTTSTPVPLSAGDWYLGVIRTSANAITYTVKASEFAASGTNVLITSIVVSNSLVSLIWTNAVPGVHYYVQGKTNLIDALWDPLSPTLTATASQMSYDVPLDLHQFFRVSEGLARATSSFRLNVSWAPTANGINLSWSAPSNRRFQVQWTPRVGPSAEWATLPNIITSTSGAFQFSEAASQTTRFYRVIQLP